MGNQPQRSDIDKLFEKLYNSVLVLLPAYAGYYFIFTEAGRAKIAGSLFYQVIISILGAGGLAFVFTYLLNLIGRKETKQADLNNPSGLGCILAMAIMLAGNVYFFWIPAGGRLVASGRFEDELDRYVQLNQLPASGYSPKIRSKVIVLDIEEGRIDPAYSRLPGDLRAQSPEEVGTVVLVDCRDAIVGKYVDGYDAIQIQCVLSIVDLATRTRYRGPTQYGSMPPESKSEAQADAYGSRPTKEIAAYITQLAGP